MGRHSCWIVPDGGQAIGLGAARGKNDLRLTLLEEKSPCSEIHWPV
jgi:hypothetical protein